MDSLEAIEARLRRIEQGIKALRSAYERALDEQKSLLLAQHRQREQLRERLLRLRQKVEGALSYGRGDPDMDDTRAATDGSGAPADDSSA